MDPFDDRSGAGGARAGTNDARFTPALLADVTEVLVRHGYPAPTGSRLVDVTDGLYRALHADSYSRLPPIGF